MASAAAALSQREAAMTFYAHTASDALGKPQADVLRWQLLKTHLRAVGEIAEEFARPLGMEAHARWCGYRHDLGKYAARFQARLRDATIHGVNHWAAGAVQAWNAGAHSVALAG